MTPAEQTLRFSVIIPTYNREKLLASTLDALAAQTYPDYEVIIVDDGGNDGTEDMIRERNDKRLKYIRITNAERGAARNAGVNAASGEYVTFLDSDDLAYPTLLEHAHETAKKHREPAFLHVAYEIKEANGQVIFDSSYLSSDDREMLITGNPLSCIGAFLRRDIAVLFPFNEDRHLSGSEDWELWLRVIANHGIKVDPRVSATMVNHPDRSVRHFNPEQLYQRKDLALQYAFADPMVRQVYGPFKSEIEAFADSYISLHLALAGYRALAVKYLSKALRRYPQMVFHIRPLVIIKRIILGQ